MSKDFYLKMRRDLYEMMSQVGADAEGVAGDNAYSEMYSHGTELLDKCEEYCIEMGWLDADSLEKL